MNTLSILIYCAELTQSLSNLLAGLVVILLIVVVALTALYLVSLESNDLLLDRNKLGKGIKWTCISAFSFALMSAVLPSRDTVLMIAASEMAERAVLSEPVQSVVDPAAQLLREWIDQKTRELRNANR